jgi:hypothetical protein
MSVPVLPKMTWETSVVALSVARLVQPWLPPPVPGTPIGAWMFVQDASHSHGPPLPQGSAMPLLAAADLQDHLMVAGNDLERLQRLLDDASQALMAHFTQATGHMEAGSFKEARQTIGGAVTAMQFQDLATQLIAHMAKRLRNCADRIARDTMGEDEDEGGRAVVEEAPLRPNPVTQDEMDAGSVELF